MSNQEYRNQLTDLEEERLLTWLNEFHKDVISIHEVLERADSESMDPESVHGILKKQNII